MNLFRKGSLGYGDAAGSSKFFAANTIAALLSALGSFYLLKVLPMDLYGAMGLILSFAMFSYTLFECRVWEYLVKYLGLFMERSELFNNTIRLGFFLQLGVGAVATLFCLLVSLPAGLWVYKRADLVPLFLFIALYVAFYSQRDLPYAILRFYNQFDTISYLTILESTLKLCLIVALAQFGLEGVVTAYVVTQAASTFLHYRVCFRLLDRKGHGACLRQSINPDFRSYYPEIRKMLFANYFSTTLKNLTGHVDKLLLGAMVSLERLALYRVAGLFSTPMGILGSSAFQFMYAPVSIRTCEENPGGAMPYIRKVTLKIVGVGLLFSCGVVGLFFGVLKWGIAKPEYLAGLPVLILILITQLIGLLFLCSRPLLFKLNRNREILISAVISSVVFYVAAIPLISMAQEAGVALAGLLSALAAYAYFTAKAMPFIRANQRTENPTCP